MRTRSQSNRPKLKGEEKEEATKHLPESGSIDDEETLSNISRDTVGKLLKRVKKGFKREDVSYLLHCDASAAKEKDEKTMSDIRGKDTEESESYGVDAIEHDSSEIEAQAVISENSKLQQVDEYADSDWEDGAIPELSPRKDYREESINGVSVEFEVSPNLSKRKTVRRATAEEKEVAEFVHKVHLLCLLGRGRLIDRACDDPLIQASLLSLLPTHLLKISESSKLTANDLSPLVNWFHNNFHVRISTMDDKSCNLELASTLENREGSLEAVTALSVALFRALNLATRFVSILDVASLKPDADKSELAIEFAGKEKRNIFNSSTLMVDRPNCSSSITDKSRKHNTNNPKNIISEESISDAPNNICEQKSEAKLKRKGDLEFQMQLEMALAATSVENSNASESSNTSLKRIRIEESQSSPGGVSTAVGSKKVGAPLCWAELFCGGDNLTGKWVHVDAVNAIVDGEDKVEAAAAACKKSLRYVVAFAGNGAKDVTRRYCSKWYKIASQRINSSWWDSVLAPLKDLESGATGGRVSFGQKTSVDEKNVVESRSSDVTRASLEDMELETRALTEPLPTNQMAYRNHHLYAIERWLKQYEIMYPRRPVLGFCSGHAVYPRTCVQTLHTREMWLREGLQVKANECPAKVLKRFTKNRNEEAEEENEYASANNERTVDLYGKWQTEPLVLPRAINGIVPKNERGQVDVWSNKCLPPGTVHLRFPRIFAVAKRLEIDYAPAMVGFEFRIDRSYPIYEGIVVCEEFKDVIIEAYAEEEVRRQAEERRRNESQALSRWYQLLSSIVTRQRLDNCYGEGASSQEYVQIPKSDVKSNKLPEDTKKSEKIPRHKKQMNSREKHDVTSFVPTGNHEHEFVLDEEELEEEGSTRVKRCRCGFSIQFETL